MVPLPKAFPPLVGILVPKVSLQLPGFIVEYLYQAVVVAPFGLAEPFKMAEVPVMELAALVVTVGTAGLTIKLNVVVFVIPPPKVVTVMVYVPKAVVDKVEIVKLVEQFGKQFDWAKLPEAPEGKPEIVVKSTCWLDPLERLTLI